MNTEIQPGRPKLQARAASLLVLALAAAVFACADEEETVQPIEMEQLEAQPEGERPPPREGPEGCYIPAQTRCDCTILEADCLEDVGVWTTGCASCTAP